MSEPQAKPENRTIWPVVIVVAIALIVRLGWGLSLPAHSDDSLRSLPDQREYLELGRNLSAGSGLVFHDDRFDADVRAFRTPGYPLLIAMCGGNVRGVRVTQAVLDASTVLAVYLLARRFLIARASLLAAAIVAINPFLIYFSGLLLSETLYVAMLAWGMAVVVRPRGMFGGMLILALSVLVRPGAIALPTVIALVAAFARSGGWRDALQWGALAAAMTALVLVLWAWRNHQVLDKWVWTTTNSGFTMYDGFNPDATGASDQRFVSQMSERLRTMTEVERSDYLSGLARRYIAEHPGRAVGLAFAKLARTWSPAPLSREYGQSAKIVAVALAYSVPLFVLTAAGLWAGRTLSRTVKLLLLVPAIYFSVAHAISVGSLRYRLPADVPMAVVAAAAVKSEVKRQKAEV